MCYETVFDQIAAGIRVQPLRKEFLRNAVDTAVEGEDFLGLETLHAKGASHHLKRSKHNAIRYLASDLREFRHVRIPYKPIIDEMAKGCWITVPHVPPLTFCLKDDIALTMA